MSVPDALALPMKEAIEFWQDKVLLKPGQFNSLADEAKLRAFGGDRYRQGG